MNEFGQTLRLGLFGASRGTALGCTLSGLPAGFPLNLDLISQELSRRAPREETFGTPRREKDAFELLSGLYEGRTDGTPLTAVFRNCDAQGKALWAFRPSHADYAAYQKYHGFNDPRGGGMFSGRMTLPLTFAGAAARQYLSGITVAGQVLSVGPVRGTPFDPAVLYPAVLQGLDPLFPLQNPAVKEDMLRALRDAGSAGDTLGGVVECAAIGLPAGLGEPFFNSIESMVSHLLFSIPGVRGVEFGDGLLLSALRGSEANDLWAPAPKQGGSFGCAAVSKTNHAGGLNGGLTNGMPLLVRAFFRPIPSLSRPQQTVTLTGEPCMLNGAGRNDICILPRGVVVVEAALCFALLDAILSGRNTCYGA